MKNEYIAPELQIICFRPDSKLASLEDTDDLYQGGRGDATSVTDEDIDIYL